MTTILITGCNGFIGQHFAKRARAHDWRIVGADLQPGDTSGYCDEYRAVDLGAPDAFAALCELPSPDLILHAGGVSGLMVETDNPSRISAVNVEGTMAIFELARRTKPRRAVICSSIMAYGPDRQPGALRVETEYPTPISVYGASKVAAEALMHAFQGQYGVDAVALRFGHVYGVGRTTQCFVSDMLKAVREQRRCHIPQARRSLRQYVHIEDVCRAIDLALALEAPRSRVFNITAGEVHTLEEVADEVRRQIGELQVDFDDNVDLPNYRIGKLSLASAIAELGYQPELSLGAGIQNFWRAGFAQ
ncbi:MAG TPA: NAD(P)-dependent oxidoreductase [Xanthobacteraceae bacterium]|nr:NAD(P)-dependent oxidoreductase [Xanthobacteraceae bacterium]